MFQSGKDIFFTLSIAGLLFYTGIDLFTNSPKPVSVTVVDMNKMISDANNEFKNIGGSREIAQLNTAMFMSYVDATIRELDSINGDAYMLDKSAVYNGPVTDLTSYVYDSAMSAAKSNMSNDGALSVVQNVRR